jgi:hypothetical protein
MKKEKRVYSPLETFTKLKGYEIKFNNAKKESYVFEYDIYALLKVVSFLQHKLVFEHKVDYDKIIDLFENAGISKEVFEEFDLTYELSKKK